MLHAVVGGPGQPAAASSSPGSSAGVAGALTAPSLDGPAQVQTRSSTVALSGSVPPRLAGVPGYRVRLYVTRPNSDPTPVRDATIGSTSIFTVRNVRLQQGRNVFTAAILGPAGEGPPSSPVTYILDTSKPKLTLSSPADGATVNRSKVEITGKTQAGSTVSARNATAKATGSTTADGKGAFTVIVEIALGRNALSITATDPAGNATTVPLTVVGGSGRLRVDLTASATRIRAASLPASLVLTATAFDPDGAPLPAADVAFTLTMAGLPPFSGQGVTDGQGHATYRLTLPAGTPPGNGSGTALVTTGPFGDASAQVAILVIP